MTGAKRIFHERLEELESERERDRPQNIRCPLPAHPRKTRKKKSDRLNIDTDIPSVTLLHSTEARRGVRPLGVNSLERCQRVLRATEVCLEDDLFARFAVVRFAVALVAVFFEPVSA